MSAYAEFLKEIETVDALLAGGFVIAVIREDLDGAAVLFRKGEPASEKAELQLLTADARKYVTSLLFAQQQLESA